jgi:hypothetical protein
MNITQALKTKESYRHLFEGKDYPLDTEDVVIDGLFIAPSSPQLFDKFINYYFREGVEKDLFDPKVLEKVFENLLGVLDFEVYTKLKLKNKMNSTSYFLYDKLSNLVQKKQIHLEEVY